MLCYFQLTSVPDTLLFVEMNPQRRADLWALSICEAAKIVSRAKTTARIWSWRIKPEKQPIWVEMENEKEAKNLTNMEVLKIISTFDSRSESEEAR